MKKPVDQVVAVGETANYTLPAASDPDFESVNIVVDMGKALNFSIFDNDTFYFSPKTGDEGIYEIKIELNDRSSDPKYR